MSNLAIGDDNNILTFGRLTRRRFCVVLPRLDIKCLHFLLMKTSIY